MNPTQCVAVVIIVVCTFGAVGMWFFRYRDKFEDNLPTLFVLNRLVQWIVYGLILGMVLARVNLLGR